MQPCMKSLSLMLTVNSKQSKLAPPFNVQAIAINTIIKLDLCYANDTKIPVLFEFTYLSSKNISTCALERQQSSSHL